MSAKCFKCHVPLDLPVDEKISLSEECLECYSDLHCCLMCQFYDRNVYNECHENQAERVVEKDKKNFCDFFRLADGDNSKTDAKQALLDAANALFKK